MMEKCYSIGTANISLQKKTQVPIAWREEGDNNKKIKGASFGCANLTERALEVGSF